MTSSARTRREAIIAYVSGESGPDVADRAGVNRTTVYRWVREAGHEVREWGGKGTKGRKAWTKRPDDLTEIIAAYESGETLVAIAKRVGVSPPSVANWLKAAGVTIRRAGRPGRGS